jgi:hypothetical protein
MADIRVSRYRIREGKTEKLRNWLEKLENERKDELIETLIEEKTLTETAFIEETEDRNYLVYYMEVEDWDYMREKFEDSDMDLDKKHREIFQDTLEQMDGEFQNLLSNSKMIYHAANPNR